MSVFIRGWEFDLITEQKTMWELKQETMLLSLMIKKKSITESKNLRNVAKSWKSHEIDLPRDSVEGTWHFRHFDFSPGKLDLDDPKKCDHFKCVFKVLSLGLFVKKAWDTNFPFLMEEEWALSGF